MLRVYLDQNKWVDLGNHPREILVAYAFERYFRTSAMFGSVERCAGFARRLQDCLREEISEIKLLQEHLHDEVGQLVYDRTHRRPMILPVVVEV